MFGPNFLPRLKFCIPTRGGGGDIHHLFQEFSQTNNVLSQRSCPSTPQQNGVAERKNYHLLDVVRTLLLESFVAPRFWCEAFSNAVHLINRLPFQSLNNDSSFFRLFGHKTHLFQSTHFWLYLCPPSPTRTHQTHSSIC